jgi:cell division protein FtsZ
MEIKPDIETFAKIKVIGVGGSGGSTINQMIASKIRGVEFVAVNTDAQALHHSRAATRMHIGKTITRGLGAGMDPEMGRKAAEENSNELRQMLKDTDMVFVTCGLGGGTGSGAAPVIAGIAKELGALTIGVVTKPFSFEGNQRCQIAEKAYEELASKVDTIISIPNDRILQVIEKKTSMMEAFDIVDDVLRQGVQGISELVTVHGVTNVDFADVKAIMSDAGSALMGIGFGSGDNRAAEAAKAAINSPLLEVAIDGAKGILFTITGGKDLGMYELNEAATIITEKADPAAKIIYGTIIDEDMKDEIRITVIAAGFGKSKGASQDRAMNFSSASKPETYQNPLSRLSQQSSFQSTMQTNQPAQTAQSGHLMNKQMEDPIDDPIMTEPVRQEEAAPIQQQPSSDIDEEDLEIPAFIRKKMM